MPSSTGGAEIVASMERAVLTGDGHVEWSETCHCSPPLAHERATVFNHHFDGIAAREIAAYEQYQGTPQMDHPRLQSRDQSSK